LSAPPPVVKISTAENKNRKSKGPVLRPSINIYTTVFSLHQSWCNFLR